MGTIRPLKGTRELIAQIIRISSKNGPYKNGRFQGLFRKTTRYFSPQNFWCRVNFWWEITCLKFFFLNSKIVQFFGIDSGIYQLLTCHFGWSFDRKGSESTLLSTFDEMSPRLLIRIRIFDLPKNENFIKNFMSKNLILRNKIEFLSNRMIKNLADCFSIGWHHSYVF